MKTRLWAIAAAVWAALYLAMYLKVASNDGNQIAWWYVALVLLAVGLVLPTAAGWPSPRTVRLLLAALTLFVVSSLLGIATIGLLLAPAVVATIIALRRTNVAIQSGQA